MRRKRTEYPLNLGQLLEIDMGPKPSGSHFRDEDDLRAAWEANREATLQRYAFTLHDAGWRPAAYWYLEVPDHPELWPDGNDKDDHREPARLRWLRDHDAFLPDELTAMRRRAEKDPNGYAAAAWRIVSTLKGEAR